LSLIAPTYSLNCLERLLISDEYYDRSISAMINLLIKVAILSLLSLLRHLQLSHSKKLIFCLGVGIATELYDQIYNRKSFDKDDDSFTFLLPGASNWQLSVLPINS
jgi:hypothetical protein